MNLFGEWDFFVWIFYGILSWAELMPLDKKEANRWQFQFISISLNMRITTASENVANREF